MVKLSRTTSFPANNYSGYRMPVTQLLDLLVATDKCDVLLTQGRQTEISLGPLEEVRKVILCEYRKVT
uniref:Phosphate acetyltransferase n=1 Tax=Ascaris lumbricoides TaxID=6252 RepID=A0A0M3HTB7_ASCLU